VAQEVRMRVSVNGIEMAVEVRGDAAAPALLLLHGFSGRGADFGQVFDLDALAGRARVIVPDLRGHGATGNPAEVLPRFHRQCADDVLALLDELGVERCRAVGTSLGGNVLLHVATRAPEPVEAMVLAGSPSYFPEQARAIMRQASEATLGAHWRQARAFAEEHEDMCFTLPLLATIRARTLIVTGDRDPLYPVEMFVEQYRAIPGASLWVIPDSGHDAIYTSAREELARRAIAFLGRGQ
jgi:pimeloyl-ACP methyl ester carboxylesterase